MFLFSRRYVVLLIASLFLFLIWLLFIGTGSVSAYAAKLGLHRESSINSPTQFGHTDGNSIPLSWMKNTDLLTNHATNIPFYRLTARPTSEFQETHHEIFSTITRNGQYFKVDFGHDNPGLNPNIIPHPYDSTVWIIVAQEYHGKTSDEKPLTPWSVEMVCNANFSTDGTLRCTKPPSMLPIASTPFSPKCPSEMEIFNLNVGPHDARVFYGPGIPYTTFGSQSQYSCLGQFVQDFRYLVDWGMFRTINDVFASATDIERPNAGPMEKNYFLFWDLTGAVYVHYDIHPKRSFAKLNTDGTAGPDLAPLAKTDARCWQGHLDGHPLPTNMRSSIHQATNSLAITLCRRADDSCQVTVDNTFIAHIYQHKVYTSMFQSRYEPYIVLFRTTAPFEMFAISSKPLWIHGRASLDQMLYITSMSWQTHGQTYHGYMDDVVFVTFGIDDADTGAIDVVAQDLLGDLLPC